MPSGSYQADWLRAPRGNSRATEDSFLFVPIRKQMPEPTDERVMRISHLRDNLGWAYRLVVETDEPIVVQRYSKRDVAMVPLWEWQFLKAIEAAIRPGEIPLAVVERAILGDDVAPCGEVPGEFGESSEIFRRSP